MADTLWLWSRYYIGW